MAFGFFFFFRARNQNWILQHPLSSNSLHLSSLETLVFGFFERHLYLDRKQKSILIGEREKESVCEVWGC